MVFAAGRNGLKLRCVLPRPNGLSDVRGVSSEPGNLDHWYPTQLSGIDSLSWAYRYLCTLLSITRADKNYSANRSLCIRSRVGAQLLCITGTLWVR